MAKNKNRVSPANVVAVIALAALGVITFFGSLFLSEDGNLGGAAIKAAIFTFGCGLLFVFCMATKTVESDFKKWRVVEYICLAAYIVVAALFIKPCLQFFHVIQHKEQLQAQALHEINVIDSLCYSYNLQAEDDLSRAAANMDNYVNSDQEKYGEDSLSIYYKEVGNINYSINDYYNYVHFDQESLDSLRRKIEMWNFMDLSAIAYKMNNQAADTWDELGEHIKKNQTDRFMIPIIIQEDPNHPFHFDGYVNYNIGSRPEPSKFTKMFREPVSGFNMGIVVYVVLHLLVLANYFLVRRSPVIEIRRGNQKDDSGLPLRID